MHRSKYVQSASNIDHDCIKLDVHEPHDHTFKLGTYPIMLSFYLLMDVNTPGTHRASNDMTIRRHFARMNTSIHPVL